ncbi:CUB domain protein [Teladorsagia circumcincta]|uniref:CUB domain protein n=1 Tax=Teladorsagia circumcincta TaxID=45464 RepID=A0A2G9UF73_TELCI|nr:CUB domain protein [Teladorsagia circumcincta]
MEDVAGPCNFSQSWTPIAAHQKIPNASYFQVLDYIRRGCSCNNGSVHVAAVGEWKELTSPAYPLSYCNNMLCVTTITAPEGHHVVLNITDFYTEPYKDVLAIFDGQNITGEHMGLFHGKRKFPYLIRNTNESLSLVFKSDHDVCYRGYRLLFSAELNGDVVDADAGTSTHFSTIVIILLSILVVIAIVVKVIRRFYFVEKTLELIVWCRRSRGVYLNEAKASPFYKKFGLDYTIANITYTNKILVHT